MKKNIENLELISILLFSSLGIIFSCLMMYLNKISNKFLFVPGILVSSITIFFSIFYFIKNFQFYKKELNYKKILNLLGIGTVFFFFSIYTYYFLIYFISGLI
ncbi:hypothetical protein HOD20_02465 [archaeon]|mgnify:CR=1 FL=1|jgi:hypothetical protein|nr:hypothetical protein [Candidatus Woesearchaeota archaeon]MBT3463756.1 hypothetical protein [archaeon]MBT4351371.1 hypothetical protein [archaeon]MBT4647547.1 hypothetical protein [archaeon]MBT6821957.1 hypothetical protein [archaeon]